MKPPKAIEYLDYILKEHPRIESADFGSAIKLGTEALAAIVKWRADHDDDILLHLPSEDPQ